MTRRDRKAADRGRSGSARGRDARSSGARSTSPRVRPSSDRPRPAADATRPAADGTGRHETGPRRARKRFGQHFLERAWVDKLVRDIAPQATESLIEIGPGRGALTLPLAVSGARIVAIEIDRDLAADLAAHRLPNVTVVTADFLELSPQDLFVPTARSPLSTGIAPGDDVGDGGGEGDDETAGAAGLERFRVVGNLPYNVSSPILFRLLALARETGRLIDATLMLQREVADRILAGPGSGDYGPLSVLTALHAGAERRFDLPPGAFRPPPKVHSTVIRLHFRPATVDVGDEAWFERMVRTVFQQRRKTIENALRPALVAPRPRNLASPAVPTTVRNLDAAALLAAADIDPRRRPETLSLPELARLARLAAPNAP